MTKEVNKTYRAEKPSLADYITPAIEAAFEAKAHLIAAWDSCNALTMGDENERNEDRVKSAFQECDSILSDCADEALREAAQNAADTMRKRNPKV